MVSIRKVSGDADWGLVFALSVRRRVAIGSVSGGSSRRRNRRRNAPTVT
jgi:hypothetical protein